jgi:hypothetical protein
MSASFQSGPLGTTEIDGEPVVTISKPFPLQQLVLLVWRLAVSGRKAKAGRVGRRVG